MKITALLLMVVCMQISAKTFSQRITLSANNTSLKFVLLEIRKQSGLKLVYNTDVLQRAQPVTVSLKQATLIETMNSVMANQPFSYEIEGNTILINPEPLVKVSVRPFVQQQVVTGRVSDENKRPLPGATVTEKGTKNYTMTNEKGEFSLKVSKSGAVLVISYIGYNNREVPASDGFLDLKLSVADQGLNEVVVTGYQKIKRQSFTGAVTTIKAADIKVASMGTLDKMLQGQVAGVAVETTSSVFGTAPKIRIRGSSSLSGLNEPLWVLDGVPLESPLNITPSELYSGGARNLLASALAGVNPEDIEDITVLRDATATAMYGTRSVNGVIVISTKRAKKNTPLNVNYSSNATLTLKPSITDFDVLNSNDQTVLNQQFFNIYQASMMNFSASNSGALSKLQDLRNRKTITDLEFREQVKGMKEVNTDWFDHLYKNAVMQQHSLSAAYGGEKATGRLSVSYYTDPGKTVGEKVDRYTVNLFSSYQITNKLSSEVMIKYARREQLNPGTKVNPFIYARDASRAMKPFAEDGKLEYYKRGYADFNILKEIDNDYIDMSSNDFLVQVNLNYKISDKLSFNTLFNTRTATSAIDEVQTEFSNYAQQFRQMGTLKEDGFVLKENNRNPRLYKLPGSPSSALPVSVLPEGGILDKETYNSNFLTGRAQFDWSALATKSGHKLNVFAGMELTSNQQQNNFSRGYGWLSANKTATPHALALQRLIEATDLPDDEKRMYGGRNLLTGGNYYYNEFNRNTIAAYTNLSYSYKDKYVLDLLARNDATNVTLRNFLPTWSAGLAWNMSKESFMEGLSDKISDVRIRSSYGLRGNDGSRGPNIIAYYSNTPRVYPEYNTTSVGIIEPENTDLEFEKEYTLSAGVDFTLFKAVDVVLNYYNRKNHDLLGYKDVAPSLGYTNKVFNWADMRNEGYEVSINLRPVKLAQDLVLTAMFNLGYNKNTIVSDYSGNDPTVFQVANSQGYALTGKPLTGLYAFRLAGLSSDGLPQYYDKNGNLVQGFVASERDLGHLEYQGSRDPLYSGGFTPTLRYKNMTLSAAFVFNLGHVVRKADFYNGGNLNSVFRDDRNVSGDFRDRWSAPGNEQYTTIPRLIDDNDLDKYNVAGFFDESIFKGYNYNNYRTVSASYLRFRNLSFQYSFPELSKRMKMQNFNIGIEASNIAVFASKRLKGQDPETLLSGLNLPPVRTFTLSLSASF